MSHCRCCGQAVPDDYIKTVDPNQLSLPFEDVETEVWTPCIYDGQKFPDYSVSTFGRLQRVTVGSGTFSGRLLKPNLLGTGYRRAALFAPTIGSVTVMMHRLVAESFGFNVPKDKEVNHINGIKSDNRLANLEVVSPAENIQHAYRTGLRKKLQGASLLNVRGENNPNSKITEAQVIAIKRRLANGESPSLICKDFPITRELIYRIKNGHSWKHVRLSDD